MKIKKGAEKGVLFEQCNECGDIFDLNYELDGEEEKIAEVMQLKALVFKQLCWGCRGKNYELF